MSNNRYNFLEIQGIKLTSLEVADYLRQQLQLVETQNKPVLVPLAQQAILICRGNEAKTFLQGQLTCHIDQVGISNSTLSAYCDQKGRVLAIARLLQYHDDYLLTMPLALIDNTLTELKRFILRSQVELIPDHSLIQIGLRGHQAEALLQSIFPVIPQQINEVAVHENIIVIRLPDTKVPQFQIIADPVVIGLLWSKLATDCIILGEEIWKLWEINNGIPNISPETVGLFTPHALNLHLLDAICFQKGCYRGQEIIARMHYLGKSKQQLYHLLINSETRPLPGAVLHNAKDKVVGEIVSSALHAVPGYEALAVLQNEAAAEAIILSVGDVKVECKVIDSELDRP